MKSCHDVESFVTPYVDGELTGDQCAAIEAHLAVCPSCRRRADQEAGARAVVRRCRDTLRQPAPPSLHAACRQIADQWPAHQRSADLGAADLGPAAQRVALGEVVTADPGPADLRSAPPPSGDPRSAGRAHIARRVNWRVWLPVAATLLFAIAGVVVFGLVSERSTALAQQLATDHLRCVRQTMGRPPADRAQMAERWQTSRGWHVALPPSSSKDDMAFVALRRCLHGGGEMAHALYRHQGRLVSLFIFPDDGRWSAKREIMGQRAAIWSQGGRTYAVVDDGSSADVERLVAFFSRAAE